MTGEVRNGERKGAMGANGLKMLIISLLAIGLSLGLSLLWVLGRVWRQAHGGGVLPAQPGPLLVLGVRLQGCRPVADFRLRLERAYSLLSQGRADEIFVLGGQTSPECGTEAACGRDYLLQRGVMAEHIRLEDHSRHTLENLRNIREMLDGRHAVIITNRYHLARSAAMAQGLNMPFELCAAEERLSLDVATLFKLLREAFFLHWYYSGALWARLVRDHASLARIS